MARLTYFFVQCAKHSRQNASVRGNVERFYRDTQQRAAVPRAWPPPTKFRSEIWGVGQGVGPYGSSAGDAQRQRDNPSGASRHLLLRCPKFLVRDCSQNFDRSHSFLLASSAADGTCKRPPYHKGPWEHGLPRQPFGLPRNDITELCHSEEWSDVGIRPFPAEDPQLPSQRSERGKRSWSHAVFAR